MSPRYPAMSCPVTGGWSSTLTTRRLPSSRKHCSALLVGSWVDPWLTWQGWLAKSWRSARCRLSTGSKVAKVHRLVHSWVWLYLHSWVIGAATLALAGGFQFSPLKERCLKQCRTPFSFFVRYYRKGSGAAWRLGLCHGIFCLGCCWALMLVMFGLGVGSLVSMAVLTGVMVVEKTFPGGQRLSPVLGIALLLLAVLWLAHPVWLLGSIEV